MHHGGTENTEKLFPDRLLAALLWTYPKRSFNALEHDHLAAEIKGQEIVFEEAVADVHLKLLFIVAGSGGPESSRRKIDRQSSDSHRFEHAGFALVLAVIPDCLFHFGILRCFLQAESCDCFRSKTKRSAGSGIERSFKLLSIDKNRIDEHAVVITKRHGDFVDGVWLKLNSRIWKLSVEADLRGRIIDLNYAILEEARS